MTELAQFRQNIRDRHIADEKELLNELVSEAAISATQRKETSAQATTLVENIRADDHPGLMEVFLAEYGLSTDEGVALMCLAEALLRVPDTQTIDDLIEDKIAPSSWGEHLGKSSSSLVNASTWALMLTGKVLDEDQSTGISGVLHGAIKRVGEPVIRTAVKRAMKEMGNQFVLGETIGSAVERGMAMEKRGFTYSYDMLGEAALTDKDALGFFASYRDSIEKLASHARSPDIRQNPGISIKLSALHPRYEFGQRHRVMTELVERTLELTLLAKEANMGLNIDAEEADRLDLSLDVIEAVLSDERLKGWDGFGVVVQAYSKRASFVIDWLYALATKLDRKIMVRLVKGAYWDTEIKRAQVEGLAGFPVFTMKSATDVAYICCAKKLLSKVDRIYPQFATHNAHSISAVLNLASDYDSFEFQRLHGMGEALHRQILQKHGTKCRIYAPVGAHRDLLAYLVRRLLENGANSSFVNQIVDESVPAALIAKDPFEVLEDFDPDTTSGPILSPHALYGAERVNSRGWDLHCHADVDDIEAARAPFKSCKWTATPLMAVPFVGDTPKPIVNPADPTDIVGDVIQANATDVDAALAAARDWGDCSSKDRAEVLSKAADLYEENYGEFFAALCREAGKTPMDCVAELREAVDFLRYYASQANTIPENANRGVTAAISPWNFPLAIFTGQIAAALAAGNGVLAKPADPTPIVAHIAVKLLLKAGVPAAVLQLLPGRGSVVGAKLTADPRVTGVCFTGSTNTAHMIHAAMAETIHPAAPLIAETGGLNAMIVDSTALPEQAVKDIIASSFQSAGQRCSALRLLYLQEDIAPAFLEMLFGAVDELDQGNPWLLKTDLGPVINEGAQKEILDYVEQARIDGRLLKQLSPPDTGIFVAPTIVRVSGIADMHKEIFGPVLHVATFKSTQIKQIVSDINASGYGLTFGLHTRIDDRVEYLTSELNVGNMYVNRNQIGAIVGSQPFGGEGLSGTGPKAGGPHYVGRFVQPALVGNEVPDAALADPNDVQRALDMIAPPSRDALSTVELPGPTGESNRLSVFPRGTVLCLGPTPEDAREQARIAAQNGCKYLIVAAQCSGEHSIDGHLERKQLATLNGFDVVALWSGEGDLREARKALAARNGAIIPLACSREMASYCVMERHVCVDTTAAGGNASLLASVG